MNKIVYFDNAATTQISKKVKTSIFNTIDNFFANPSSIHFLGKKAKKLVEEARKTISSKFGVPTSNIIFTSGATESNNLLIKGHLKTTKKKEIITTTIEHDSILSVFKELEEKGYAVHYLDVDTFGHIDLNELKKIINKNTALLSISVVNSETGAIQNYKEISKICRENHVLFHGDAAQSLGLSNIDYSFFDALTISAHKIHGPKGIGALVFINDIALVPEILGGGQENNYRSGTENPAGIYGFKIALQEIDYRDEIYVKTLKEHILNELEKHQIDFKINGDIETDSPFILNLWIKGFDSVTITESLSLNGICVSTGSACINNTTAYSHVILSMFGSEERARSSIRLSFSKFNNIEECDLFVEVLKNIIYKLKEM